MWCYISLFSSRRCELYLKSQFSLFSYLSRYIDPLNVKDALICSFHVIRILLEDPRTSVDTAEKKGQTALHIAALKGNYEIMEVLLEMTKVDVNATDEAGSTALHIAGLLNNLLIGVAFKCIP